MVGKQPGSLRKQQNLVKRSKTDAIGACADNLRVSGGSQKQVYWDFHPRASSSPTGESWFELDLTGLQQLNAQSGTGMGNWCWPAQTFVLHGAFRTG